MTAGGYQHNNGDTFARNLQSAGGFASAPSSVFDGESFDTTLILGANSANGKANITAYVGFLRQNGVLQSQRDFSACSISNISNGKKPATYSGQTCAGSVNYSYYYPQVSLNPLAPGNLITTSGWFMGAGGKLTPVFGNPPAADTFNYGAYNTLLRPDIRFTGGAFAHYEVDKHLDIYASLMFTDDHNSWQAAPSALFFGQANGTSGSLAVNCDNPLATGTDFVKEFCPGGVPSTAIANVLIGRRNIEGGPRITDFRHTSYRMVIGAKGDLGDDWSYDVSAQESMSLYQQLYLNDLSKANVSNAVFYDPGQPDNLCTGTCVPLDIFHGIGAFTPAMEGYIKSHGQRTGYTEERIVTGAVTGNLGQYGLQSPWANEGVGIAFGAEYRDEHLEETTSVADYSGDLFGAGGKALGQPLSGFAVKEGFGELRIPVVRNMPFMEDLSLNAGYRYSSFSTSGAASVKSYEYGAEWQPIDDFRLRASFQRAVRSANVLELFAPDNVQLGSFSDPCGGHTPTGTLAGCEASGVTAAEYGHISQCPANQCNYQSGGNTALNPEQSDTRSLGIVLTPTFISGFNMTVDYFDISVEKYINLVQPTVSLDACVNQTDTALCSLVHRGSSGTLLTTDGYVIATNVNTGYLKTSGVDFQASYLSDLNDLGLGENGSLAVNFIGTYVSDYLVQPYTGANIGGHTNYNCVGLYGITCGTPTPSWRHKMRVTWSTPWDVDLSIAWRHMSSGKFDGNSSNPYLALAGGATITPSGGASIADYDYIDLAGSWMVRDSVQLSLGVNNIFDKDPPLLATGGQTVGPTLNLNGNTFDGIYDSLGRYMFVKITLKE